MIPDSYSPDQGHSYKTGIMLTNFVHVQCDVGILLPLILSTLHANTKEVHMRECIVDTLSFFATILGVLGNNGNVVYFVFTTWRDHTAVFIL